jgi:UDP-N-acetylmuramyl pentapeptide synthase
MTQLTLNQLQMATGGRWLHVELRPEQRGDAPLGRVAIDSREVRPCDTFWALAGEHRDGLDFVDDAFLRGAAGVVSSSDRLVPPWVAGRWRWMTRDKP